MIAKADPYKVREAIRARAAGREERARFDEATGARARIASRTLYGSAFAITHRSSVVPVPDEEVGGGKTAASLPPSLHAEGDRSRSLLALARRSFGVNSRSLKGHAGSGSELPASIGELAFVSGCLESPFRGEHLSGN